MRIPENTIRTSHIRTYGSTGFSLEGVADEPGCPHLYKAKYVDGGLKEMRSYALEYGTLLHDVFYLVEEENLPPLPDALEKAWARAETTLGPEAYQEAIDDLTTYMDRSDDGYACVAVEQELTAPLMEIDGVQYYFGGRLDWIGIDPTQPNVLVVKDYKSNRFPPRQQTLDADNQFTHYIALAKANAYKYLPDVHPDDVRVIGIMDAFKWRQVETYREEWQIERYMDWLMAMCRRIVQDNEALPVLNEDCAWCPLRMTCPEFTGVPVEGEVLVQRFQMTDRLEDRVELMEHAMLVMKNLKPLIADVQDELKTKATHDGPQFVGDMVFDVEPSWENVWDVSRLATVLGDDFLNVVGVTAYKVDAVVKRKPELKEDVERCKTRLPKDTKKLTVKNREQYMNENRVTTGTE